MSDNILEQSKVTKVGHGVYTIRSASDPNIVYQVDIFDNDGLGGCSCKNFVYNKLPKYDRSSRVPCDSFRCKHLKRVRSAVLDKMIMEAIEKEKKQRQ